MENASPAPSFLARNEFLIRRLHSLSGLVPVGAYMVVHLLTNASVLDGPRSFQARVDQIHSLGGALPLIEWAFIFLPIIFHAVLGVAIIRTGAANVGAYGYAGNWRYTLQRVTAWIALFFIFYHVLHLHGWIRPLARTLPGTAQFDPHHATSSAAAALQSSLIVQLLYVVGVLSCVFHLANGLWTSGITWGVWTSAAAQRRADYACAAFGIGLAAVALGALGGMLRTDVKQAQHVESQLELGKKLLDGQPLTAEEAAAAQRAVSETPAAQASPAADDSAATTVESREVGNVAESTLAAP